MGMSRQAKEEAVAELTEMLTKSKGGLIAAFSGLNVKSVNEVRTTLREAGVEYKVVKNTLIKRALAGTKLEGISELFQGPTAVALKNDDEYGKLGKACKDLNKKFKHFQIRGGFIDEDLITNESALETMAALPTLDEARSMILGVINAPATQLLGVIGAPGTQLLGVIEAKRKKDEEAA